MVSKFQWKPFWLATQQDPQNDWTATQNRVNYDVFAQAHQSLSQTRGCCVPPQKELFGGTQHPSMIIRDFGLISMTSQASLSLSLSLSLLLTKSHSRTIYQALPRLV